MNTSKFYQVCMKILLFLCVLTIIVVSAFVIYNFLALAAWVAYDDISFVNKGVFYKQLLVFSDLGSFRLNISSYSSEIIFCVMRVTLLIYVLDFINTGIRLGTLFDNVCYKALRWVGIRFIVFPYIALAFSTVIHFYLKTGFSRPYMEIGYLIIGIACIICSFLFKFLNKKFRFDIPEEDIDLTDGTKQVSNRFDIDKIDI